MITIPPALQAKLDSGATTLAWCWRLERSDGVVLGFTDHDRALRLDGLLHEPDTGLSAGQLRTETGAAPARGAVFGALNASVLIDEELDAGLWDGAKVAIFRVDWVEPDLRYQVFTGEIGAIKRGRDGFEAELSGPSAKLNRTIGRVFSRRCDAELGDGDCGVNLQTPERRVATRWRSRLTQTAFQVTLNDGAPERFTHGLMVWRSGRNTGFQARIKLCQHSADGHVVELDRAPPFHSEVNDEVELVEGCDKSFETCRTRFSNALNFRGCPHMPGNDALIRAVSAQSQNRAAR